MHRRPFFGFKPSNPYLVDFLFFFFDAAAWQTLKIHFFKSKKKQKNGKKPGNSWGIFLLKQMCFDSIQPSFRWKAPFKTYPGKASVNYSLCLLIYLVLFDNHQIEKILRASRNVPLVKEAKLAKTFVCLHSRLACFSVPKCETTLHVSASQRRTFVMPPKIF